ncbi:MAG: VWA domain-containing protein [Acetobacteraceae bacterium]
MATNPEYFEIDPNKQYIIAVDISGSMRTPDAACAGQERYPYALEKVKLFIKESESFDPDGPTILLFGESVQVFENTTLAAVDAALSSPSFEGATFTDKAVQKAYELHKAANAGDTVLLVITDGAPTDRKKLEEVIKNISNSVAKDDEFSISFLTVGTIDAALDAFLKGLDDDLKGAKFDIVDVKALESVSLFQAVKGAISD